MANSVCCMKLAQFLWLQRILLGEPSMSHSLLFKKSRQQEGLGQGWSTECLFSRSIEKPRNELWLSGAAGTRGWPPFVISLGDRLVPSDVIWASAGTSVRSPLTGNDISYQQSDSCAQQTCPAGPPSGASPAYLEVFWLALWQTKRHLRGN